MIDTIRSQRIGPCKGCPDKVPACADHCRKPVYLAWREEQARIKAAQKAYQSPAWIANEMDPGNYRKRKKAK